MRRIIAIILRLLPRCSYRVIDRIVFLLRNSIIAFDRFRKIQKTSQFPNRHRLWAGVVDLIGSQTPITFVEFGVYRGESIEQFVNFFPHADARFFGFDTFYGLPHSWTAGFSAADVGTFSTGGEMPKLTDNRVTFIKGVFSKTLPTFFQTFKCNGTILAHFDADLYSSTLCALFCISQRAEEFWFIFDEWMGGEAMAFDNFLCALDYDAEFIGHTVSAENGLPMQVAGVARKKNRSQ